MKTFLKIYFELRQFSKGIGINIKYRSVRQLLQHNTSSFILLLIVCLNFKATANAQITVRNSSYMYVDNQVVFSSDYLNLKENTTNFYLRNDAQLIQGIGITGNSGLGKLSVYQYGNVHNYAYNYWCSPVGTVSIDDFLNHSFAADNNIYDVGLTTINSSPANFTSGYDGTTSPLYIARTWIYTYDSGTNYSQWDFVGSDGNVSEGLGFTMKGTIGSSYNQLYDFRGKANNGTMYTNVIDGEQTLVGNPYPSALDAYKYIHDSNNQSFITGTLYFWEQDLSIDSHNLVDYRGGYAEFTMSSGGLRSFVPATFNSYDADGTLNTVGSSTSSGKQVFRYLTIGQGFMVQGSANGTVRTINDMRAFYRASGSNSEFFRTTDLPIHVDDIQFDDNGFEIIPEDYKRFRLNIDFNELYTRQLLQNFHKTATSGFDYGLESEIDDTLNSDAYWILESDAYVTQAFNYDDSLEIPLQVVIAQQQSVRFRILDVQHFDESQPIFLHDIENGVYINLRQQNYDINLSEGIYNERFKITFSEETLTTHELEYESLKIYEDYSTNALIIINPEMLNLKTVEIVDVSGKQILLKTALPLKNKYNFSTRNLSTGVYIAQLTLQNNKIISQK